MGQLKTLENMIKYIDTLKKDVEEMGDIENFYKDQSFIIKCAKNIELIGESVNKLGDDIKIEHPEVEWLGLVEMRNGITHDYEGINLSDLYDFIHETSPDLRSKLIVIKDEIEEKIKSGEFDDDKKPLNYRVIGNKIKNRHLDKLEEFRSNASLLEIKSINRLRRGQIQEAATVLLSEERENDLIKNINDLKQQNTYKNQDSLLNRIVEKMEEIGMEPPVEIDTRGTWRSRAAARLMLANRIDDAETVLSLMGKDEKKGQREQCVEDAVCLAQATRMVMANDAPGQELWARLPGRPTMREEYAQNLIKKVMGSPEDLGVAALKTSRLVYVAAEDGNDTPKRDWLANKNALSVIAVTYREVKEKYLVKEQAGLLMAAMRMDQYRRDGHARFAEEIAQADPQTRDAVGKILGALKRHQPPQEAEKKAAEICRKGFEDPMMGKAVACICAAYRESKEQGQNREGGRD